MTRLLIAVNGLLVKGVAVNKTNMKKIILILPIVILFALCKKKDKDPAPTPTTTTTGGTTGGNQTGQNVNVIVKGCTSTTLQIDWDYANSTLAIDDVLTTQTGQELTISKWTDADSIMVRCYSNTGTVSCSNVGYTVTADGVNKLNISGYFPNVYFLKIK